ncbi:ribonucleotide-diphosphate reductase subunit beta [Vreelandella venusta]|uniref:ribonucleotide-diphosphate reductase subunit beta n=1 Tax=Vreelandella venusta TaxID=44935 RepID=UPI0011683AB2|nr:ribonucleotide-diphosphate reductase subunit beta [Halomonas venusta]GEK52335.1 hypothetical protein HVE01_30560 [Halomonas venusta]
MKAQIMTPKSAYTTDYPAAIVTAQRQFKTLWSAEELGVEKDEDDVRSRLIEGERKGLIHCLKLFTQYELEIGEEFWTGWFFRKFPRHDMRRAASACGFVELNSHAPFYALINEILNLANDEFYNSWREDPVLVDRMDFIESHMASKDPYEVLAAFSFMEGVVLYSSFAFLKSFNMNGFGLIPHITAGIDASCKEEHSHFLFSSWTYRQLMVEEQDLGLIDDEKKARLAQTCRNIALAVYEHEAKIVDQIFSFGSIRTITKDDIMAFVRNRIDEVLKNLNCEPLFNEPEGAVSAWFYDALSTYKYADFFANNQVQYVRTWNKMDLQFNPEAVPSW